MRIILISLLLVISRLAIAAPAPTIFDSSVNWDDMAARTALLTTAKTPQWDNIAINDVYNVYAHPKEHQLPPNRNDQKYNTEFLDAYWGPLSNPFVKYARPAKVFVYIGEQNTGFMAPVIKNATDGNFYVFNRANPKPQLLEEWVNAIKSKFQSTPVKFNICNGYGNLATDTCDGKSYQSEENFALSSNGERESMFKASVNKIPSAIRAEGEDWRQHLANNKRLFGASERSSIVESSVAWDNVDQRNKLLQTTVPWSNYTIIQQNFEKLRDLRYFNDSQKKEFLRRISWLYPDDGCWTRASAVINHLFGATDNTINQFSRPSKVFAFGNLCANTPNHKSGKVSWWYHTAPLIRDAQTNQTYVLDPSIDAKKPVTMEAWVEAISAKTGACQNSRAKVDKINVCTGFGTGPNSVCASDNFVSEAHEALRQSDYQKYERARQKELGRDADKVLGDEAPWM